MATIFFLGSPDNTPCTISQYTKLELEMVTVMTAKREMRRGGNEICTCLFLYLQNVDQQKNQVCHVSLYCDNCMGESKNKQMLAMIQHFLSLSKKIRTVSITYIVPERTYTVRSKSNTTIR
jgi:hypothetical protein